MDTELRTLDWKPRFDPASRNYRVSLDTRKVRNCDWRHGPILDQGREGACVGFAAAANLMATKRPVTLSNPEGVARGIYISAQRNDEWPGENYEGTSVLAGQKALSANGYLKRYEWAFGLNDALLTLSWKSPLQIGVWWHAGMWDTNSDGFIRPTGGKIGGHSVLVTGVNPQEKFVTIINSWGPDWGQQGTAKITFDHFGSLLADDGEAVSILKVKR